MAFVVLGWGGIWWWWGWWSLFSSLIFVNNFLSVSSCNLLVFSECHFAIFCCSICSEGLKYTHCFLHKIWLIKVCFWCGWCVCFPLYSPSPQFLYIIYCKSKWKLWINQTELKRTVFDLFVWIQFSTWWWKESGFLLPTKLSGWNLWMIFNNRCCWANHGWKGWVGGSG